MNVYSNSRKGSQQANGRSSSGGGSATTTTVILRCVMQLELLFACTVCLPDAVADQHVTSCLAVAVATHLLLLCCSPEQVDLLNLNNKAEAPSDLVVIPAAESTQQQSVFVCPEESLFYSQCIEGMVVSR